jgi:carbamoyl-phosphate synthase large subunit
VGIVHSQSDLANFLKAGPVVPEQLIVQKYIDGTEFTVSVTVWRDGNVQAVVPKEIICKKGITRLAVTRHNSRIDGLCRDIQERLRADGPFNVQLRLDKNSGMPLPFEINPRYSTTVSLTIAAGVDELGGLIKQATGQAGSQINNNWREGVVLLRRTLDEFVDEADFNNHAIKDMNGNPVL